jgi:GT2 family glycosyltransferase
VAAVGPLLLYGDRTVQHAGVVLGPRGTADHVMRGFPQDCDGYHGSLVCDREVTAVTAACMMLQREMFEKVGGFNELFRHHYEDVDLCLRLRSEGYRNLYVAGTKLLHHESKSRGRYYSYTDRMLLQDQWHTWIGAGDPYYNGNLDPACVDYSISTEGLGS